jgi:hypothetical protein
LDFVRWVVPSIAFFLRSGEATEDGQSPCGRPADYMCYRLRVGVKVSPRPPAPLPCSLVLASSFGLAVGLFISFAPFLRAGRGLIATRQAPRPRYYRSRGLRVARADSRTLRGHCGDVAGRRGLGHAAQLRRHLWRPTAPGEHLRRGGWATGLPLDTRREGLLRQHTMPRRSSRGLLLPSHRQ